MDNNKKTVTMSEKGYLVKPHSESRRRYVQILDLKDDKELIEEYRYYHDKGIWPEIVADLKNVGICDMEIYLAGNRMVMIVETPEDFDFDAEMTKMGSSAKQQEWEEFMWRFQQKLPWITDDTKWVETERIFSLVEK